ncbi:hypothetical protein [Clostridium peptidivorans]|uniref:hypothetical protein n=1 Tax=Clostridium peptidivorans TaxID=100174 RepID=UPI000BE25428|nr:hypothetical protein [Clostridium peptidivorans]
MKKLYISIKISVILYLVVDLMIACNVFGNKIIGNYMPLFAAPILLMLNSKFYQKTEYKNKKVDSIFNVIAIILFILIIAVTLINW